jgi:hypothetical protein
VTCVTVRKSTPACCRRSLFDFAKQDRYDGGGEPGDRIRCSECGNWLVYKPPGWEVDEALPHVVIAS